MKLLPHFCRSLGVAFALATMAVLQADPITIPGPNDTRISANIVVVDQSSGHWNLLPAAVEPTESGFTATVTPQDAKAFDVTGTFEKSADSVKCKLQWSGVEGLEKAFLMFVLTFPVDEVANAEVVSDGKDISISRLLSGEGSRNHLPESKLFTLGPYNGRTLNFAFETPIDLSGLILGGKDFFHLRLMLSPREAPLAPSGDVNWTVSWATPAQ